MRRVSLALLLMFSFQVLPLPAQQNELAELQARESAEVAMKSANSNVSEEPAKAQRRTDLENVLLYFDAKTSVDHVYFYDEQPASDLSNTASVRLVAVTRPAREVYR